MTMEVCKVEKDFVFIPQKEWHLTQVQSPAYIISISRWGSKHERFEKELIELLTRYELIDSIEDIPVL